MNSSISVGPRSFSNNHSVIFEGNAVSFMDFFSLKLQYGLASAGILSLWSRHPCLVSCAIV